MLQHHPITLQPDPACLPWQVNLRRCPMGQPVMLTVVKRPARAASCSSAAMFSAFGRAFNAPVLLSE